MIPRAPGGLPLARLLSATERRTTELLERLFGEDQRRTKVIPHIPL